MECFIKPIYCVTFPFQNMRWSAFLNSYSGTISAVNIFEWVETDSFWRFSRFLIPNKLAFVCYENLVVLLLVVLFFEFVNLRMSGAISSTSGQSDFSWMNEELRYKSTFTHVEKCE